MFAGKPIIGIVGGIGSGKSFIADLFAERGCLVVKADDLVHQAYQDPMLKETLRSWWGDDAIAADGSVDRKAIAKRIFENPQERKRLEQLVHPLVFAARDRMMSQAPDAVAFVWDTPLLFETGLDRFCDSIVFVDAPEQVRQDRVSRLRGWEARELVRREKAQLPLDKKRSLAHHVVQNTADAAFARRQVEDVLSQILRLQ